MIPNVLHQPIDETVPSGVTHVGFVPTNVAGQILIAQPHGNPYGVSATFSKVKIGKGERSSQALSRCLAEQIGVATASVYPIPHTWVTPNSVGYYFAGLIRDGHEGVSSTAASLQWLTIEQAKAKISKSQNPSTRQRDLALLASVSSMCVSPYRNVLLMIRELHRMGFERLRAYSYIYSLGTWRCAVAPAAWIKNQNQVTSESLPFELHYQFEKTFSLEHSIHFYTSASEQQVFQSPEAVFMTPRELARKFIKERREIAAIGFGPDPEYIAWYERTLEMLAPNGVFYAFAEFEEPTDHLYASMSRLTQVPLPPPGQMERAQWDGFLTRLKADTE
jgi:hypothetical protein